MAMGDWPQLSESQESDDIGALTASSSGTVVTAGTANTKGSWAQLIASTAFASAGLLVAIGAGSAHVASTDWLVDIGVGAAGVEQVLIPNMWYGIYWISSVGVYHDVIYYPMPVPIPSGVRVSARSQCTTASATCAVSVSVFGSS